MTYAELDKSLEPRNSTIPRYELHLTCGGAVAIFVDETGSHPLDRSLFGSLGKAIKAIDDHAKREVWPYNYDAYGGWAPAGIGRV